MRTELVSDVIEAIEQEADWDGGTCERAFMTQNQSDDVEIIPIPGQESEEERRRLRESNDRDQRAERQGQDAPHNAGYDEVADLTESKPIEPTNDN